MNDLRLKVPTRKDAKRTWEKIITGTIRIWIRDGYTALSYPSIAREAGLKSHHAIYWHFPGGIDIVASVALQYMFHGGMMSADEYYTTKRWVFGLKGIGNDRASTSTRTTESSS